MYGIMHIFQTVVRIAPPIGVPCVGERGVIGLIGDELVCQYLNTENVRLVLNSRRQPRLELTPLHWPGVGHWRG